MTFRREPVLITRISNVRVSGHKSSCDDFSNDPYIYIRALERDDESKALFEHSSRGAFYGGRQRSYLPPFFFHSRPPEKIDSLTFCALPSFSRRKCRLVTLRYDVPRNSLEDAQIERGELNVPRKFNPGESSRWRADVGSLKYWENVFSGDLEKLETPGKVEWKRNGTREETSVSN